MQELLRQHPRRGEGKNIVIVLDPYAAIVARTTDKERDLWISAPDVRAIHVSGILLQSRTFQPIERVLATHYCGVLE